MRAVRELIVIVAIAGLCGCEAQVAPIGPQAYQISVREGWPADTHDGAVADLDYNALGLCPHGYTKTDEHGDGWGNLVWKIRCD